MHSFPSVLESLIFLREGVFGMAIILFLLYEPEGIAKLLFRAKNFFKLWPYTY
jgi:branched-chain amino acid transport system permease protein